MATVQTTGINPFFENGGTYDAALNDFLFGGIGYHDLKNSSLVDCGPVGALEVANAAFKTAGFVFESIGQLDKILRSPNTDVIPGGKVATSFNGVSLVLTGSNLDFAKKGPATVTSFVARIEDSEDTLSSVAATLVMTGNIKVSQSGVESGTISSVSYNDGLGTVIDLAGKVVVNNGGVTSVSFTKATISNTTTSLELTGKFGVPVGDGFGSPAGAISSIKFKDGSGNILNVTDIKNVDLDDFINANDEEFSFEENVLAGNDTISVIYGATESKKTLFNSDDHGVFPDAFLKGYAGNDTLRGGDRNDVLDGGMGADRMIGGRGNDTYYVDNAKDTIVESAGRNAGDNDTVIINGSLNVGIIQDEPIRLNESGSSGLLSYRMAANVETAIVAGYSWSEPMLQKTGMDFGPTISITGNAGNNTIYGNVGNDTLNGGAGNDVLFGESPVEREIPRIFFSGADTLIGGAGNDTLVGGFGRDILTGGTGSDNFVLSTSFFSAGDRVTDFRTGVDKLVVDLGEGGFVSHNTYASDKVGSVLNRDTFALNPAAFEVTSGFSSDTVDELFDGSGFYFDTSDGELWFVEEVFESYYSTTLVATLDGVGAIAVADIVLIGVSSEFVLPPKVVET